MERQFITSSRLGSTIVLQSVGRKLTSKKVSQKISHKLFPSTHGFSEEELYLIKSYCSLYKVWCEIKDHIIVIKWQNGEQRGYLNPSDNWSMTIPVQDKLTFKKLVNVRNKITEALKMFQKGVLTQYSDPKFNPRIYNQYSLFVD